METYGFIENKVYAKLERGYPGQWPHPELFVANSEGIFGACEGDWTSQRDESHRIEVKITQSQNQNQWKYT